MHPPPPTEAVLLTRARGGDLDAYEQLVRLHQQIAFRTAVVLTRNRADAEEAAQDAFVKAWHALPRFDDARPFRPWLLAIVANEARNRRRSAGRSELLAVRAGDEPDAAPHAAGSPEAALLVGGGVLAAAGAGSRVLEGLGLRNADVTQVDRLPPVGADLALGRRHTLAGARRLAGFALLRPTALGAPREVYVDAGVVTFVYRARSGRPILFTQVPGSAGRYVQKFVTENTRRVRVDGVPALLLRGPHAVFFDARGGGTRVQEARLAENTLMWERGGLLLRLEAEQPAGELIRIARSVRAAR